MKLIRRFDPGGNVEIYSNRDTYLDKNGRLYTLEHGEYVPTKETYKAVTGEDATDTSVWNALTLKNYSKFSLNDADYTHYPAGTYFTRTPDNIYTAKTDKATTNTETSKATLNTPNNDTNLTIGKLNNTNTKQAVINGQTYNLPEGYKPYLYDYPSYGKGNIDTDADYSFGEKGALEFMELFGLNNDPNKMSHDEIQQKLNDYLWSQEKQDTINKRRSDMWKLYTTQHYKEHPGLADIDWDKPVTDGMLRSAMLTTPDNYNRSYNIDNINKWNQLITNGMQDLAKKLRGTVADTAAFIPGAGTTLSTMIKTIDGTGAAANDIALGNTTGLIKDVGKIASGFTKVGDEKTANVAKTINTFANRFGVISDIAKGNYSNAVGGMFDEYGDKINGKIKTALYDNAKTFATNLTDNIQNGATNFDNAKLSSVEDYINPYVKQFNKSAVSTIKDEFGETMGNFMKNLRKNKTL